MRDPDEIANLGIMAFITDKNEGFDREFWNMRYDFNAYLGPREEVEEFIKKIDDEVKDWWSQNRMYTKGSALIIGIWTRL